MSDLLYSTYNGTIFIKTGDRPEMLTPSKISSLPSNLSKVKFKPRGKGILSFKCEIV